MAGSAAGLLQSRSADEEQAAPGGGVSSLLKNRDLLSNMTFKSLKDMRIAEGSG